MHCDLMGADASPVNFAEPRLPRTATTLPKRLPRERFSPQTGCCRSNLAGECRRRPIPDVGRLLGQLSAVPWNLTFDGLKPRRVSDAATRPRQRLLPLAANGRCRPIPAHPPAPKLPDDQPGSLTFRIYEAAVRDLRRSASCCHMVDREIGMSMTVIKVQPS